MFAFFICHVCTYRLKNYALSEEEEEIDRSIVTNQPDILGIDDGMQKNRNAHSADFPTSYLASSPSVDLKLAMTDPNSIVSMDTSFYNEEKGGPTGEYASSSIPLTITINIDPECSHEIVHDLGSAKNDQLL